MDRQLTKDLKPGHLFVFGLGYSTTRLSKRLMALGWRVSGTNRSEQKVIEARSIGISSMIFDQGTPLKEPESIFGRYAYYSFYTTQRNWRDCLAFAFR